MLDCSWIWNKHLNVHNGCCLYTCLKEFMSWRQNSPKFQNWLVLEKHKVFTCSVSIAHKEALIFNQKLVVFVICSLFTNGIFLTPYSNYLFAPEVSLNVLNPEQLCSSTTFTLLCMQAKMNFYFDAFYDGFCVSSFKVDVIRLSFQKEPESSLQRTFEAHFFHNLKRREVWHSYQ